LVGAAFILGATTCEKVEFAPDSRQSIAAPQVVLRNFIFILSNAEGITSNQTKKRPLQSQNYDSREILWLKHIQPKRPKARKAAQI
jgi:hypothetical protein